MSVTDEIKERLDIVEVISEYVPLKKSGRNFKGLCPFHNEKTPSFVVFPDNQSWHCFGACGTGGDVFTFIMKRENMDFGEALELLADRAGVALPARGAPAPEAVDRSNRLREIVADAAAYYHYLLKQASEAQVARDYLARRQLLPETWEAWQLGYALDSWDALKDRLVGKGYNHEEIEEAGLIIRRDDGSGYYDRFRGRLMIPIRDVKGRTIGFGARILREDPERPQPKYINSPDTPLFNKSDTLYGLDMARKAIRDADRAVIVEGYMDVLGSHQVGVRNVVAGMGTALTESQLRRLKRYSNNITLALDPDAAGVHATLRGLETARQTLERTWDTVISPTGLVRQESRLRAQLRIATLPDGLDPDELALQDVDRWRQVIAKAKPIVDYYLLLVQQEEDLTSARGKANAVERMAPIIREIAHPVERSHYTQALARLVQTDERLVEEQIARLGRGRARGRGPQTAPAQPMLVGAGETDGRLAASFGPEEYILGCLLSRPDLLAGLDAEMIDGHMPPIGPEDFVNSENRAIMTAFQATLPMGEGWTPDDVLTQLPDVLQARCLAILERVRSNPMLPDEKIVKDLGDSLLRQRERRLHQQISRITFLIRESEEAGARQQLREYQELILSYSAQKRHVDRLLNARTMLGSIPTPAGSDTAIKQGENGSARETEDS